MPPTGSTFTDWQQVEQERRLLMNEDFSWSEPPQRRRRRITEEPIRAHRQAAVREHEPAEYEPELTEAEPVAAHAWDQPTAAHSHFDEMMEQWNAQYGDGSDRDFDLSDRALDLSDRDSERDFDRSDRAFDLSDPGAQGGRRTVVITGRGDERYMPAPRRARSAELRFHERSTFSPDRGALWALLIGIALTIGAIVH